MRIYKTTSGDTWDLIAFRVYRKVGAEKLMDALIDANSEYINTVIFSAGISLNIPEINSPVVLNLPPWKK
ncbi:MAG: tail protein X [Synergistaceae bacterium]|nr:tail protein X [Synergistaceae bacterium]